jgi:serine/threonine protein kinase
MNSERAKLFENFSDILVLKNLKNERLVEYLDAWFENDFLSLRITIYVQMELCDGNLEQFIKYIEDKTQKDGKNSLTSITYCMATNILIQILKGVNCLHQQKPAIVHGNLKPKNILFKKVDKTVSIKITDTGFRAFHGFAENRYAIKKDEKYLAPEVLNTRKFDTKSDVYSLGVIINELFCIGSKK